MGEIKTTVDTEEVENENKEDENSDSSKSDSDEDSDKPEGAEGEKPEEKKPEETEEFKDDGEEPLTRHEKNKRYAEVRIAKKEAKRGNKQSEDQEEDFSEDSDDDTGLTPEEEKLFDKYIEKKGILAKVTEIDDKQESINFNDFMSKEENKIFEPFKEKIWRFSQHKDRKNLPFSTIAWEVAGPHLLKMGANIQKEADKKAKENSSGGTQNNKVDAGRKPVEKMTNEEFKQYISDIKSGNITK